MITKVRRQIKHLSNPTSAPEEAKIFLDIEALTIFQIAMFIALFVWGLAINLTEQGQELWFQRMGALMTIYSIYIETFVFRYVKTWDSMTAEQKEKVTEFVNTTFRATSIPFEMTTTCSHKPSLTLSKWLAHISLILGTIIWAYGDLLYLLVFDLLTEFGF